MLSSDKEMDLPPEPHLKCIYYGLRLLLHAVEEGEWRLEAVSVCNFVYLTTNKTRKVAAIDFFGAFLALAGSAMVVLALTWAGGEYSWHSAHVIASLIVGIFVSLCFGLWQWKGTMVPLVPGKLSSYLIAQITKIDEMKW
jgi:hypothetical protein